MVEVYNCVCGLHTVTDPSSTLQQNQKQNIQSTIPRRKAGVFAVENLDSELTEAESEPCLQLALDAVSFWLEKSTPFRKGLVRLLVDYHAAGLSTDSFMTWVSENPLLDSKLQDFLSSKPLPTIRLESDLKKKYNEECDLYGVFDPDDSNFIYINSALIKNAKANQDNSLAITFIIFAKVIHELSHWITHFTMKEGKKICTPTGIFDGESGEYMEKAMFGGIVTHHSKSAFCPWEVELVIKDKVAGSKQADFFDIDYMKQFFDKDVIERCTLLHSLKSPVYTVQIQDRMLAIVTKVSTNDELVKPTTKGKYDGHTTAISLDGVGGQDFIAIRDVLVRKKGTPQM